MTLSDAGRCLVLILRAQYVMWILRGLCDAVAGGSYSTGTCSPSTAQEHGQPVACTPPAQLADVVSVSPGCRQQIKTAMALTLRSRTPEDAQDPRSMDEAPSESVSTVRCGRPGRCYRATSGDVTENAPGKSRSTAKCTANPDVQHAPGASAVCGGIPKPKKPLRYRGKASRGVLTSLRTMALRGCSTVCISNAVTVEPDTGLAHVPE